ncbi:MAG: MFS transporter [Turicibacter sp.]|nr:MFS transporter [Turicibacter sp.]
MTGKSWIYKVFFLAQFGALGAFLNYFNLYLEQEIGLVGSEIGLLQLISLTFMVMINPVWGMVADRTGKYKFLLRVSILGAIFSTFMLFHVHTFALVVVMAILMECLRAGGNPLAEVITTNFCDKNSYDFSKIRVFGSIGWLVGGVVIGFLIDGMSLNVFGLDLNFDGMFSLGTAMIGMYLVLRLSAFALTFLMPKDEEKIIENPDTTLSTELAAETKPGIKALLVNKQFLFLLCFIAISGVVMDTANGYSGMHLVSTLGAQAGIVGTLMFASVFPEILFLPFGGMLVRKIGFKNVYYLALIAILVRLGIYSFTYSIPLFLVVSVVHVLGVIMHVSGNIAFLRKVVPANQIALAFTIMASVLALTRALLGYVFGIIYETSSFMVYRVAFVIVLFALIVLVRSKTFNGFDPTPDGAVVE